MTGEREQVSSNRLKRAQAAQFPFVRLVLALLAVGYVLFAINRNLSVGITNAHLILGARSFYKLNHRWPSSTQELISAMDAPYAVEIMKPKFKPTGEEEALLYYTDWSYLIPIRETRRIVAIP